LQNLKVLKTAPEHKSLMSCHHFNDVAVADCAELNTCQKLADVAIHTHFFTLKLQFPFFFFFLI
jgi:hypothetical protein